MKRLMTIFLTLFAILLSANSTTPFVWSKTQDNSSLTIELRVAPNCYLYAESTTLMVSHATLESAPKATEHYDSLSESNVPVYATGTHQWIYRIEGAKESQITVNYQGCRESENSDEPGICFMPEEISLSGAKEKSTDSYDYKLPFEVVRVKEGLMNVPEFVAFLKDSPLESSESAIPWGDRGVWMIILLTLLGGMGLNLTPCILPMIPINLAILGADGSSWRQGAFRATFYGAGMAIAYGVLGLVVVLTGAKFGALNASSWFNFGISGVFLALSLAMFGVFNLDFSGLSTKIDPTKMGMHRTLTAFFLGVIAALLAGACVAPVVIAVVVFSSELYLSGSFAGLLLPFVLGLGMALPWPLAGAGLAVLPKPGAWMNRVKQVFGIIIVLAAGYYAYMGYQLLPGRYDADKEFAKLEQALVAAQANQRPLLIKFDASWCKNCAEMSRNVLPNPQVQEVLKGYEIFTFSAEDISNPKVKALLDALKINGLPAFAIVKR